MARPSTESGKVLICDSTKSALFRAREEASGKMRTCIRFRVGRESLYYGMQWILISTQKILDGGGIKKRFLNGLVRKGDVIRRIYVESPTSIDEIGDPGVKVAFEKILLDA